MRTSRQRRGRRNKFFFMVNPFKPGDKVLILRQGVELEATVRTTFNHEVQVRLADGELLWRTVKTARLIVSAAVVTEPVMTPTHEAASEPMPSVILSAQESENLPQVPAEEVGATQTPATVEVAVEPEAKPETATSPRKDKRRNRHSRNR